MVCFFSSYLVSGNNLKGHSRIMKKINDYIHILVSEIRKKENIIIMLCFFWSCLHTIDIHFIIIGSAFSDTWRTPYEDMITNTIFISYPLVMIVLLVIVVKNIFIMGEKPKWKLYIVDYFVAAVVSMPMYFLYEYVRNRIFYMNLMNRLFGL